MPEKLPNTEEIILKAANKLFKQKGFDGATVQDIADEAGTTKSMVNYYFRSKEKLFTGIFHQEFKNLFSTLASFINSEIPLKEKIEKIVEIDTDKLIQYPDLPAFIVTEINRNPGIVFKNIENLPIKQLLSGLNKQIEEEVKKGNIRPIKAEYLLINIQSLTIFPFVAKPMMLRFFGMNEKSFKEMLLLRKQEVVDIIWKSLQP